jgi:ketosteroid isomerase-like protein
MTRPSIGSNSRSASTKATFVVMSVRFVGRGRSSGASFEEGQVQSYRVRAGRIVEVREYREMSEALEAVGLSEQDAQADS